MAPTLLPPVIQTGILISGVYQIAFPTDNIPRIVRRIAITGPSGSSCNVYVDNTLVDATPRGDINSWESAVGIYLPAGSQLRLVWNVGTGAIPNATLICEGNTF